MAIATINGESRPSTALYEPDLAGAGAPVLRPAGSAVIQSNGSPLLASSPRPIAGAPVPFYKPMPVAIAFTLRVESLAPALRGYAPSSGTSLFGEGLRNAVASIKTTPAPSFAGTLRNAAASIMASSSHAISTSKSSTAKSSTAKSATAKSSTAKSSTAKSSTAKSTTSREIAFLDDKHLSIEDKLFQFMVLMTKKNDQELIDAMKEYEGKKAAQSSASSEKTSTSSEKTSGASEKKPLLNPDGGGGFFGFLGDVLGSVGKTIVGGAESLARDLGGPALASVATALGMPFLAPVALKIGGDLSSGLIEGVASTVGLGKSSATRSSGSTAKSGGASSGTKATSLTTKKTSAAADPEEFDEKLEMFKLQRLVEKQNAMFSALTNAMKSMHDSQMTAVQNIR